MLQSCRRESYPERSCIFVPSEWLFTPWPKPRATPLVDYAVYVDADNRPMNHKGDWPMKGRIYAMRIAKSRTEGIPLICVLTFRGEMPYFNAFASHRFGTLEQQ